ncbi:MAG: hypothetical protein U0791_25385 [Gemmataceae bacterium]
MFRSVLVLAVLAMPTAAMAQPPGGPAKELFVSNATQKTVEIKVLRPSGNGFVIVSQAVKPGDAFHGSLVAIKGDRIIVAAKPGAGPLTVLDTAHFNAQDSAWPSIGFALVEDDGEPRLVHLLMAGGGVKAANPKQQKLLDANKEAVMKGVPKTGTTPPEKEKE